VARSLKVGLILECGPDGADKKVCEYLAGVHLARLIGAAVETSSVTLDNKPGPGGGVRCCCTTAARRGL
jgi:hypothetical protein